LAVDRPGRPVIVRVALLLALISVGEDAEAELGIFVEDLALGHVVADVPGDEGVVFENVLDDLADFLAAGGARICGESLLTGSRELLQSPAHCVDLLRVFSSTVSSLTPAREGRRAGAVLATRRWVCRRGAPPRRSRSSPRSRVRAA